MLLALSQAGVVIVAIGCVSASILAGLGLALALLRLETMLARSLQVERSTSTSERCEPSDSAPSETSESGRFTGEWFPVQAELLYDSGPMSIDELGRRLFGDAWPECAAWLQGGSIEDTGGDAEHEDVSHIGA